MPWGNRVIFNTRERSVSDDKNALQQLQTRDRCDMLRSIYGTDQIHGPFLNPGFAPMRGAPDTGYPLPGDVYSGLMVRCDNAAFLLVDQGTVGVYFASLAASSDDSPYVVISDPGISITTTLLFTANTSGSIRWDVVEVQPVDQLTGAQESRDFYDPATRLQTAGLVDKRRGAYLSYRIRHGTPGGGMPANDPAWLPIACIHVNSGATGFNQCDVYDVRPLVADRSQRYPAGRAFADTVAILTSVSRCVDMGWFIPGGASGNYITGYSLFEGYPSGYLAGGDLRRSMPSSNADFGVSTSGGGDYAGFNFALADNRASSLTLAANHWYTLAAVFPNNLPRWVRYQQSFSERLPVGPRGILVLSDGLSGVIPTGIVSTAIAMPSICGLGTVPQIGVALAHIKTDSAGNALSSTGNGNRVSLGETDENTTRSEIVMANNTHYATVAMTPGTDVPPNASRFSLKLAMNVNTSIAGEALRVEAVASSLTTGPVYWHRTFLLLAGTGAKDIIEEVDVPIIHSGLGATQSEPVVNMQFQYHNGASLSINTAVGELLGWSY